MSSFKTFIHSFKKIKYDDFIDNLVLYKNHEPLQIAVASLKIPNEIAIMYEYDEHTYKPFTTVQIIDYKTDKKTKIDKITEALYNSLHDNPHSYKEDDPVKKIYDAFKGSPKHARALIFLLKQQFDDNADWINKTNIKKIERLLSSYYLKDSGKVIWDDNDNAMILKIKLYFDHLSRTSKSIGYQTAHSKAILSSKKGGKSKKRAFKNSNITRKAKMVRKTRQIRRK
uniref:Uncharacterized protein n=1 Tax=viral metagenome TaxID=1070528 RepID=A0A6C0JN25_9ZZZZ